MKIPDSFFLIGSMGAGKSTIGQLLANELDYRFIDTDHEIESRIHMSIASFFAEQGEAAFRQLEQNVLTECAQTPQSVIATGGGIILSEANRILLAQSGCVIFLDVSVDRQLARLATDSTRPLLQTADRQQRLLRLAEQRLPLYQQTAHIHVRTDEQSTQVIVTAIIGQLHGKLSSPIDWISGQAPMETRCRH